MPWKSDMPTWGKERTKRMVRARPGNPTLKGSLALAGQPGMSSGWHGLLLRSHHGRQGRGCGARCPAKGCQTASQP